MEPGREPAEVQAYRKLLTASSEHFNILRSAPAFSHDEHWDTQYQKVRMDTRDDTDERARLHRDGRGRRAQPLLASLPRPRLPVAFESARNFARVFFAFWSITASARDADARRDPPSFPRRRPRRPAKVRGCRPEVPRLTATPNRRSASNASVERHLRPNAVILVYLTHSSTRSPFFRARANVAAAQAFKSFARLWRFQQEHRAALTDAGLRRWEIGEIASRVGQLYYAFYLRTGEGWYLSESHAFFQAATKREYFAECHQTPALAQKRLRHRARHVVTCLLVDKLEEAGEVVEAWRRDVDAYAADHRPADAAEWRAMTDDAAAFVEANVFASRAIGSNGSVSHGGDRCPRDARRRADDQKLRGSLGDANASKRVERRLGGVVTCGTYPSQVRFGDWTLDAFRVHRACEWEDVTTRGNDDGAGSGDKRDERAEGVGAATPSASVASSPKGPPPTHHRARSRTISFSSAGSGFESSNLEGTLRGSSVTAESAGGLEQRPDDDERVSGRGRDETETKNQRARRSPTPRKYAVRAASARRFLLAAATACEELERDETLLLYLSARGGDRAAGAEAQTHASACPGLRLGTAAAPGRGAGASGGSVAGHFASLSVGGEVSLDGFPSRLTGDTARGGWAAAAAAPSAADAQSAAVRAQAKAEGQPGRGAKPKSGPSPDPDLNLYPADLAPLTRRRLFVVVDADAARQFHLLSGYGPCGPTPGGETPVVLAAAPSAPPRAPPESKHGRFFTLFLTNPATGARALCGLPLSSEVRGEDSREAERRALERVAETLLEADAAGALDPAWSDAVGDPFTRRFATHFALCRALVAAHATTRSDISPRTSEESGAPSRFTPTCSPPLPASCDARACAPHAAAFVEALGLEREFRFA